MPKPEFRNPKEIRMSKTEGEAGEEVGPTLEWPDRSLGRRDGGEPESPSTYEIAGCFLEFGLRISGLGRLVPSHWNYRGT
jgi:hypothetical protein